MKRLRKMKLNELGRQTLKRQHFCLKAKQFLSTLGSGNRCKSLHGDSALSWGSFQFCNLGTPARRICSVEAGCVCMCVGDIHTSIELTDAGGRKNEQHPNHPLPKSAPVQNAAGVCASLKIQPPTSMQKLTISLPKIIIIIITNTVSCGKGSGVSYFCLLVRFIDCRWPGHWTMSTEHTWRESKLSLEFTVSKSASTQTEPPLLFQRQFSFLVFDNYKRNCFSLPLNL